MNQRPVVPPRRLAVGFLVLAAAGCDLGTGSAPEPATVEVRPGVVNFDAIGDARHLEAEVRDERGNPMEGAEVEWRSSNPSVAAVAPDGTVTSRGNGTATITATAGVVSGSVTVSVSQAPNRLEVLEGDEQEGEAGAMLPVQLRVRVTDRLGVPVQGVTVTFTAAEGSGTVSPRSVVTDGDGIAETNWRLGPDASALQRVSAGVLGAARLSASFHATATPGDLDPQDFSIEIEYTTSVSAAVREAFERGAERWAEAIVEKLPPRTITVPAGSPLGACDNPQTVTRDVDDLHIFVSIVAMDGPGGTLAQARPCVVREETGLPSAGFVRLDRDDVDRLAEDGRLDDVVLHEIGHVLGIGSLWRHFGLLRNPSLPADRGADTHFAGQRAIAAFDAVGGEGYQGGEKVPVENQEGGQGTRDSHWRLSVFGDELMVGFISGVPSRLSRVTLASLADLGYAIEEDAADPYTLPMAQAPEPAALAAPLVLMDDVLEGPILVVDREGAVVRTLHPEVPEE